MKVDNIKVSISSLWLDVILNTFEHYDITWINDIKGDLDDNTLKAIAN